MRALFDRFKQEYLATLNQLPDLAARSKSAIAVAPHVAAVPAAGNDVGAPRLRPSAMRWPVSGLPEVETAARTDSMAMGASGHFGR